MRPAAQGALTARHSSPLVVLENVTPVTHGVHWRSAVAEPAVDMPSPATHLRHAEQALLPTSDLNCPDPHISHVRSLCSVAWLPTRFPAGQGALTAVHGASSLLGENDTPRLHAVHWRSATALPCFDKPCPAGHELQATHAWLPAVDLNVPAAHAAHVRSDVAVAAASMYCPASHWPLMFAHARSCVVPAALVCHCVPVQVV